MIWRVLFTYLHLLAAGLAAALLIGQHWLLKRPVDRLQLGLLGAMALGQLLATIAILATGIALTTQFGMGAGYYLGNFLFLLKMGLFLTLAGVAALPLAQYLRWNRASRGTAAFAPQGREVERVRASIALAIGLMALLPLPAILLAAGFGN
jgi:putative membrane protein